MEGEEREISSLDHQILCELKRVGDMRRERHMLESLSWLPFDLYQPIKLWYAEHIAESEKFIRSLKRLRTKQLKQERQVRKGDEE